MSTNADTPVDDAVKVRIHGDARLPTLIYLPGLHGDWTLVGPFRQALRGRLRFAEITYPRTLTWSLDDYAAGLAAALRRNGITDGWLLAESFGSQIAWPLVARGHFPAKGIIVAGGFVRHPMRWAVRLAERIAGEMPLRWIVTVLFGYARLVRFRHRHSPEVLAGIDEFLARRTELDRQAAKHRLHLVATNDPADLIKNLNVPVFALAGFVDPVVPWFCVRRWLRRHSPALREYRVLWPADHNVLGTAPEAAADVVVQWISQTRTFPQPEQPT